MRATKTDKEKQMSRAAVDKGIGRIAVFINDIGNPPIYNPASAPLPLPFPLSYQWVSAYDALYA